jgi:hypothetical protein
MGVIHLNVDETLKDLLGNSPEQIERNALERIVLDLYRQREISVSRAAGLLGLDQLSFIRWSGELGVPFFDMTAEDWEQELRGIADE